MFTVSKYSGSYMIIRFFLWKIREIKCGTLSLLDKQAVGCNLPLRNCSLALTWARYS